MSTTTISTSSSTTVNEVDVNSNYAQLASALDSATSLHFSVNCEGKHCLSALSEKEHSPVLHNEDGHSVAQFCMIDGQENVSATTFNDNTFEGTRTLVDSAIAPASTRESMKKDIVMNNTSTSTNYNQKDGFAISNSCPQGQTLVASTANLKVYQTMENDGGSEDGDDENGKHFKQMASNDHPSKGLSSLSPLTLTAFSNVELPFSASSKSSLEKREKEPKSPKPFSSIPGPWPSLPFIGTGWQYFSFGKHYDFSCSHCSLRVVINHRTLSHHYTFCLFLSFLLLSHSWSL